MAHYAHKHHNHAKQYFDLFTYIHSLRKVGVSQEVAEIQGKALKHMSEQISNQSQFLLTKADQQETNLRIVQIQSDVKEIRHELILTGQELKSDIVLVEERLGGRIDSVEERLGGRIDSVEERLSSRIDSVELKFSANLASLEERLSVRIDSVEERLSVRIDSVEERLNGRIDSLEERLNISIALLREEMKLSISKCINSTRLWMFSMMSLMLGVMARGFHWI